MRGMVVIAALELRRFLKDRSNIFFVFIFPLLLVLVVGLQFGGGGTEGRVAVAGPSSELRQALTTELEDDGVSVSYDDAEAVRQRVARGRVDVGVFLDHDAASAFTAGDELDLAVVRGTRQGSAAVLERVRTAAEGASLHRAQQEVLERTGASEAEAQAALQRASAQVEPPRLEVVDVDEIAQEFSGLGQFDLGAVSQTLLFVFLISLAGASTLIQARRLGVMSRTLAAPISAQTVILGQALGRWTIAMFQGLYIVLATSLLFDVEWNSLWLSVVVLAAFAAVAAGAAMLLGALVDNENAAVGIGIGLGLVLAALGGSMLPLELFPDTLRTVANVTPHAWAYEAYAAIQRHDAGLADVLGQLAVLVGMATALLVAGAWALRRSLDRAL